MSHAGRYLVFERKPADNAWLDLVRSAAIVLVLLRHGYRSVGAASDGVPRAFASFLLNGWIGVDLFFVLSGYLISRHLLRNGLGTHGFDFRRYVAARALRIVPAYVATIALVCLSAFPLYAVSESDLPYRVAYHLLFLQDYLPSDIEVVFWSLAVEEKFYLLAPLFVWFVLTRGSLRGGLVVILGALLVSPIVRAATWAALDGPVSYDLFFRLLRSPFHASLEPILLGTAIALVQQVASRYWSPVLGGRILGCSALAMTTWLCSHEFLATIGPFDAVAQPTIVAILCGLVVVGAAMMDRVSLPLEPAWRILARLSYALYLVHYPLLPLSRAISDAFDHRTAVFWSFYLASSIAAAALLHFCVEKPFFILKDKRVSSRRQAFVNGNATA